MTNEEKADLLRKELRNARTSGNTEPGVSETGQSGVASDTSSPDRGHDNSSTTSSGTGDKTTRRKTKGSGQRARPGTPGTGNDDSTQRGITQIVERQRQSDRRSSVDNSSFREPTSNATGSDGTGRKPVISVERFQRTDGIPERNFDREESTVPPQPIPKRPGRPKNQTTTTETSVQDVVSNQFKTVRLESLPKEKRNFDKKPIFPWFKSESLLTAKETNDLREPLESAIKDYAKYADQYITYKTKSLEPVWSDLDDDEVKFLANFFLKRGQVNAMAASTVRNIVNSNEYMALAFMLGPRATKSYKMLNEERKKQDATNPQRANVRPIRVGPFRSERPTTSSL
jgi:hypothetical protein